MSQPRASTEYMLYLPKRMGIEGDGDEATSGSPRGIVRDAAREKLSTVIMDMTVEAKQRFRALRIEDGGAAVVVVVAGWDISPIISGRPANAVKATGERAC